MFAIESACIEHIARYESRSQDGRVLVIKMTRPISRTSKEGEIRCFQGVVGAPADKKTRAGFLSEWFEAYITSSVAEHAFKSNLGLKLGEKAAWTTDELEEANVFEVMCRLGLSLIPKMDGIGSTNDNGHSASMATGQGSGAPDRESGTGFW